MSEYLSLFFASFVAATFLPFYSEILLGALLIAGKDPTALWAWATAGNTLGSLANYVLARYFISFKDRKWFPIKNQDLGVGQKWFNRYGVWSLLFAWAPIGGDALTFVAGLMLVPVRQFLVLVAVGKGLRYAAVIWLIV